MVKVTEFQAKCPTKPPILPTPDHIRDPTRGDQAVSRDSGVSEAESGDFAIICSTGQHREMLAQVLG